MGRLGRKPAWQDVNAPKWLCVGDGEPATNHADDRRARAMLRQRQGSCFFLIERWGVDVGEVPKLPHAEVHRE